MASTGETIAADVHTQMQSGGAFQDVTQWYGIRTLEEHRTYDRILWVPTTGQIDQTKYIGGRPRASGVLSKQLRSALVTHDVFIHTEADFESLETLWKAFVAACVQCLLGSVKMGETEWITETQSHDFAVDGYMIRQRIQFAMPINDTDLTTVEVTDQTHTGTFQGETGDTDVC
jgi:hypothetical protein